jgi:ABC-type multidrug transport system ATPase subunit
VSRLAQAVRHAPAVDGVSFDVATSECYGLLGPNGAGQATTVSMVGGLVEPEAGVATVLPEVAAPAVLTAVLLVLATGSYAPTVYSPG